MHSQLQSSSGSGARSSRSMIGPPCDQSVDGLNGPLLQGASGLPSPNQRMYTSVLPSRFSTSYTAQSRAGPVSSDVLILVMSCHVSRCASKAADASIARRWRSLGSVLPAAAMSTTGFNMCTWACRLLARAQPLVRLASIVSANAASSACALAQRAEVFSRVSSLIPGPATFQTTAARRQRAVLSRPASRMISPLVLISLSNHALDETMACLVYLSRFMSGIQSIGTPETARPSVWPNA